MLLKKDVWLSKQIGFNAYDLKKPLNLDFSDLEKKLFITLKMQNSKKKKISKAIKENFKFIDINYKFVKKIKKKKIITNQNISCQFSKLSDKEDILSIAKEAFKYSRFQIDKRIPKNIFNKIQSAWISNFFKGNRGTHLVVAKKNDITAGFLLIVAKNKKMLIDLIATSKKFQRIGVASSMINFAINNISFKNFEIEVGTQKKNRKSVKFYEKNGFKKKSELAVYHYLRLN